jgi:hypothetical protein
METVSSLCTATGPAFVQVRITDSHEFLNASAIRIRRVRVPGRVIMTEGALSDWPQPGAATVTVTRSHLQVVSRARAAAPPGLPAAAGPGRRALGP